MKINFTKKQYRLLLDIVFAGDNIINGFKIPSEHIEEYEKLQQHIYSFAKDFGLENLIEYDSEYDMFFETREFEDSEINEIIDQYDNDVFWDELAFRLAKRDVRKGKNIDESFKKLLDIEEKYSEEFYKNGLKNVKVIGMETND